MNPLVEEKMPEFQARKRALAAGIYHAHERGDSPLFDTGVIAKIFEPHIRDETVRDLPAQTAQ